MNMFKSSDSKSVKEYLQAVPKDKRNDFIELFNLIKKFSGKKEYFANNMIGFGKFEYINHKKDRLDWPIIALANQKNYFSVYVCALDGEEYLAEKHKDKLGNVSVGKSCIRINKIEDINVKALEKVIKEAIKSPGLVINKRNYS